MLEDVEATIASCMFVPQCESKDNGQFQVRHELGYLPLRSRDASALMDAIPGLEHERDCTSTPVAVP